MHKIRWRSYFKVKLLVAKMFFLLLLSIFLLRGCWSMSESEKMEIYHAAFRVAEYNKKIEDHHKTLEDLNAFVLKHLDTILKYKKSERITAKGDSTIVTFKERKSAVIFYDRLGKDVPLELVDELKSYWDSIGDDLLESISISNRRWYQSGNIKKASIRYTIYSDGQSHKENVYSERHFILYNDSRGLVDTISSPMSSLVKEVYEGELNELKYYIEIQPYTGF